jgi:hypothetical protein
VIPNRDRHLSRIPRGDKSNRHSSSRGPQIRSLASGLISSSA